MDISILWCEAADSGRQFPVAQFAGDTDAETQGFASLTSVERQEVVVGTMKPEEFRSGSSGVLAFEARMCAALGRTDLRANELVSVGPAPSARGLSFQEFNTKARPRALFFQNIFGEGSARVLRQQTVKDFQSEGGQLTTVFDA